VRVKGEERGKTTGGGDAAPVRKMKPKRKKDMTGKKR